MLPSKPTVKGYNDLVNIEFYIHVGLNCFKFPSNVYMLVLVELVDDGKEPKMLLTYTFVTNDTKILIALIRDTLILQSDFICF